jgi:tetratricopeptide (TPR) repeat protein
MFMAKGAVQDAVAEYELAIGIWEEDIDLHSDKLTYRQQLIWIHTGVGKLLSQQTGRRRDAEKHFRDANELSQKLLSDSPDNVHYRRNLWERHHDLIDLLMTTGQQLEATKVFQWDIDFYEKLSARFPNNLDYQAALALARGQLHKSLGEMDKATAEYSKAIDLDPKRVLPSAQLGYTLWQYGNSLSAAGRNTDAENIYRRAAAVFESLTGDSPTHPYYLQEVGHSYKDFLGPLLERIKRPDEAEQVYRKAVTVHQKLVVEFWSAEYADSLRNSNDRLAALLSATGRAEDADKVRRQAIVFYEKQLTANPGMPEYWREIGQLYIELSEWDKAISAYTKVIELKSDDSDACYKRGWMYSNMQQWSKAIDDYSQAIKRQPKRWESWSGRGFAHLGLHEWDKSIEDYTKAIELAPDVHTNWHHRGLVYFELGRWDKLVDNSSELVKRYPNDYNALHLSAVAHVKLNQPELAVADLRQAFAKGYKDLEGVKKDERFAPLRNREDFKKLLADRRTD